MTTSQGWPLPLAREREPSAVDQRGEVKTVQVKRDCVHLLGVDQNGRRRALCGRCPGACAAVRLSLQISKSCRDDWWKTRCVTTCVSTFIIAERGRLASVVRRKSTVRFAGQFLAHGNSALASQKSVSFHRQNESSARASTRVVPMPAPLCGKSRKRCRSSQRTVSASWRVRALPVSKESPTLRLRRTIT